MTTDEIMQGNKLIAEFMGYEYSADSSINGHKGVLMHESKSNILLNHTIEGQLSWSAWWHESWDWLMPVVEKIEHLDVPTTACIHCEKDRVYLKQYPSSKLSKHYARFISVTSQNWDIADCSGQTKIEAAWNCIVTFIKWYTANGKQTNSL